MSEIFINEHEKFSNIDDAMIEAKNICGRVEIKLIGQFYLKKPITIDNTWRATELIISGEDAEINCGRQILEWEKEDKNLYYSSLDVTGVRQVIKNGNKINRAKSTNIWHNLCGWYHPTCEAFVDGELEEKSLLCKSIPASIKYGAIIKNSELSFYSDTFYGESVEFVLLHDWVVSYIKVKGIYRFSDKSLLIAFDDEGGKILLESQWPPKRSIQSFRLENCKKLLKPNEFYFDYNSKRLYYKLKDGENIQDLCLEIPILEQCLKIENCSKKRIEISGINFCNIRWEYPDLHGFNDLQAANYMKKPDGITYSPFSAVTINNADNVVLQNCTIENCGGNGLSIINGSRNTIVKNNKIINISGSGIVVGSVDNAIENNCLNTIIESNNISNIGQEFCGGIAIQVIYSGNVTILNNEIENTPYTAISVGWGWSDAKTNIFNVHVVGNNLNNIANTLADGGAIYILGRQDGTVIENNKICGLHKSKYTNSPSGVYCIYLDEGACFVTVVNNSLNDYDNDLTILLDKDNSDFIAKNPQYKCKIEMKNSNNTINAIKAKD